MRNQRTLTALDEAAATAFDQAEAAGATIEEATTAAQEAVSRAVTAEGSASTSVPADEQDSSTSVDKEIEEKNNEEEELPTNEPDPADPSDEVQSAAAPSDGDEGVEDFIDAQDGLDHLHPTELMGEGLSHWIDADPDLAATSNIPSTPLQTPIADDSSQGNTDAIIEDQMDVAQEQEEMMRAENTEGPTEKKTFENDEPSGHRDVPYGPKGASRSFTPRARKIEDMPAQPQEKRDSFARLLRMLERRESSYTMEAKADNQFKMADTTVGDWIEISAPVLGEHLLFLAKESHQLRQRVAVRDEQLRIVSGRGIEFNQKLKSQANEIDVAHANEDISIKAAQVARKTLAEERRVNNNQALLLDEELAKSSRETRKANQEVAVQKAVITNLESDRIANTQARKLAEARSKRLERIGLDYEDRLQDKEVKLAELRTTHQSLQEDMVLTKAEIIGAQETVAEAEHEVRIANERLATRHQPHQNLQGFPPLPIGAAAQEKTMAMENRVNRLEEENNVLKVRVSEDSQLRTNMVESLTDCGAFISSAGRSVPRELLLRVQANILQAIDHDSPLRTSSPTQKPKENPRKAFDKPYLFDERCCADANPTSKTKCQQNVQKDIYDFSPTPSNAWIEVDRGSKGQGSSRRDAERGRQQEANEDSRYDVFNQTQNFHLPEGSGQTKTIRQEFSEKGLRREQLTTPGKLPVTEDVVVSAYSPRQQEFPSASKWATTSQGVGSARAQEIPKIIDAVVPVGDAQASSSEPSVPRAQQDFALPGGTGQTISPSQLSPPTTVYVASTLAGSNRDKLVEQEDAAVNRAKRVALPSMPVQEAPRFRDVSYSISNAVRSLQIAGHGDKNFHSCRGAFRRVAAQWKVTEDQRKLCMPFCFTEDASRIFEVIANDYPLATSDVWWEKMQQKVSNEAQAQSARQEFMNLKKLPTETMRAYADRGWRLASCLPEQPTEVQVKPQVIMGLPPKLKTAALLAQSLPFDNMVSTIEQIIANDHDHPQSRSARTREPLQIVDEQAAEELAIFHEKQRQTYDDKEQKIWTKQGVGTLESPMGPRDDVLPFGFSAAKPCFRCKFIGHLASYRGIVCERSAIPPSRKQPANRPRPKNF
jgi:hypothetical protein